MAEGGRSPKKVERGQNGVEEVFGMEGSGRSAWTIGGSQHGRNEEVSMEGAVGSAWTGKVGQ